MRINIATKLDEEKLIGELRVVSPDSVLVMSHETALKLCNASVQPINEIEIMGIRARYKGYKVYIDDDMKFGEVDIR